jgi:hypothetical protein
MSAWTPRPRTHLHRTRRRQARFRGPSDRKVGEPVADPGDRRVDGPVAEAEEKPAVTPAANGNSTPPTPAVVVAPVEQAEKSAPERSLDERLQALQSYQPLKKVDEEQLHPNSLAWAEIVKHYSTGVLLLVAVVVVAPLVALLFIKGLPSKDRLDALFKWSNTVLPTVVGLGSAVIAYYYGRTTK